MKDTFGRDLSYLRISITDRCNYRCRYCMPEEGVNALNHDEILSYEEIAQLIPYFIKLGVRKIRLTGGEPTVRKDVVDLVRYIASFPEIEDIALTTNGSLLKSMAVELKQAGLHRLNISIDSLKEDRFSWISRTGKLSDVLEGIDLAKHIGLGIKLNCVISKGINDDEIDDFIQLTKTWGVDVRFIELMPIGDTADYAIQHFVSNQSILEARPYLVPTIAKDLSSPASYYRFENALGRVGLISPLSCNFCANCNRLRLTPDGKLKPCLHSDIEIDLRTPLRNNEDVMPYILEAIKVKPEKHLLEAHQYIVRSMNKIGG